ncbi:MAG: head-tail adaptor protein [Fibrobacter sp.]|nr:head-tail adaptor protein [Fibrobacter sp.]
MSLLDEFCTDFCVMEKERTPDGEGGFATSWFDGATFQGALMHDTTILAQQAEQENTASTFSLYVPRDLALLPYDYIKRKSDGQVFRITSAASDDYTPASSTLNKAKVQMQKASLPT